MSVTAPITTADSSTQSPLEPKHSSGPLDVDTHPPFQARHLGWLLVITTLAAALRLLYLGKWSMWVDEGHTFRDVACSSEQFWSGGPSGYPLSYLLSRGFLDALTDSEWGLRLPFAIFGIASVPALAFVARPMVGRHAAVLAAAFLAVSPWHVFWSQNARSYSMVLFFSVLAIGAFYQGFRKRSPVYILLALLGSTLAGFSHPSAFMLLGAVLVYAVIEGVFMGRGRVRSRWLPLWILVVMVVMTPFLVRMLAHYGKVQQHDFSLFHLAQTLSFYVGIPMLVAAAGGMLWLFDRGARCAGFLSACAVLPVLALSVLSTAFKVTAQYGFYTLPAFYILAAVLVVALVERFRGSGFRPFLLRAMPVMILMMNMIGQDYLYFAKEYGWRPRFREAARMVEQYHKKLRAKPLRVVTTNRPSLRYYMDKNSFYPDRSPRSDLQIVALDRWNMAKGPKFIERQMEEANRQGQEFYVVVTAPELEEMDVLRKTDSFLRGKLRQIKQYRNWLGPKDMVILVYHRAD